MASFLAVAHARFGRSLGYSERAGKCPHARTYRGWQAAGHVRAKKSGLCHDLMDFLPLGMLDWMTQGWTRTNHRLII